MKTGTTQPSRHEAARGTQSCTKGRTERAEETPAGPYTRKVGGRHTPSAVAGCGRAFGEKCRRPGILASGGNGRRAMAAAVVAIRVIVGLFGMAGLAGADTLVSNLAGFRIPSTSTTTLSVNELAQVFTTGPNITGYQLESISLDFDKAAFITNTETGQRSPVYVYLQEGGSNAQIATLTKNGINYAGPGIGVNKYSVWKARCYPQPPHGGGCLQDPSSVHLNPSTQYRVYIWAGNSANHAALTETSITETGATGWSIANRYLTKPAVGSSSFAEMTSLGALRIKVEGRTNPEVTVSISDVTVTEGTHATADFVVSLNRATGGPVTFDYETTAGTASDTTDYSDTDGTLTIQPGETRKTISIPIADDRLAESDETFDMVLSNLRGANSFADATGTATIVSAVPLAVSINDASAVEGVDETIDFTVKLNRRTVRPVTINVLFSSGTADFADVELNR